MFLTKLKRVTKAGSVSFWRNKVVSLASVLVMVVTLFVMGSLLLLGTLLNASLDQIKEKVDINVYFKLDAPEEDVFTLKASLEQLPEVAVVEYVSRDRALSEFKARHGDNTLIIASLEELGENPLGAALNVRAKEPSQYEGVARFLDEEAALSGGGVSIIDKVNFNQNKEAINKLASIIETSERLGVVITIVFALIAILVTFNTIRLAIYTAREEIAVMKLVGASNNYVRGPFVVEGVLYGMVSAVVVSALLYPVSIWVTSATGGFFGALDLSEYYLENFFQFAVILLFSGVALGIISSWLAVHRHLKV